VIKGIFLLQLVFSYVTPLEFMEGYVTGKATNHLGAAILVNGISRRIEEDDRFHSLEHGDWVRLGCAMKCWIFEIRKRGD